MTQLDLQQRLEQAEEKRDALQQRVNELTAENSLLRDAIFTHQEGFSVCEACGEGNGGHQDDVCLALKETPATEEAINDLMAQGVDKFGLYYNFSGPMFIQREAKTFSARLRAVGADLRAQGASNEQD